MTRDTFVFDSGATSHMRFSKDGMVNLKPLKIAIKVGNAEDIYSEAIGTFKGLVTQKDGSTFPITLEDVLYISDLYVNLFYMTRVLKNKTVDFKREKGIKIINYYLIRSLKLVAVNCWVLTLYLIKRTYTSLLEVIKSYMNRWDIHMMLSSKQLQRSLILIMIRLFHVRTVLVLRSRLKLSQRTSNVFSKRKRR
jgi:hypothetical protein